MARGVHDFDSHNSLIFSHIENDIFGDSSVNDILYFVVKPNVKEVRLLDVVGEVVSYDLKPLPRQLGQKYGARFPAIRKAILKLDPKDAATSLQAGKPINVRVEGEDIKILPEEVEVKVEAKEGFSTASEGSYVAALTTEITKELELEGLSRDFVRRVQDLRKSSDLNIDDEIEVQYAASDRVVEAVEAHMDYIKDETLAKVLKQSKKPAGKFKNTYTFGDEKLSLAITPTKE